MKTLINLSTFGVVMLLASQAGAQTLSPGFPAGTYSLNGASFVETAPITSLSNLTASSFSLGAGMPSVCEVRASSSATSLTPPEMAQFFLEHPSNLSNGIWYRGPGVVEASFRPATMGDAFTFPLTQTFTINSSYNSLTLDGNLVSGTAVATQTITITEAQVRVVAGADFIANCMGSGSSSGAGTSSPTSAAATASTSIITSDVARVTRSAMTASNSMMSSGIARLVEQQQSNSNVVSSNASALSLTPRLNMIGTGGLSGGGSLFGDTMTAGGVYRRITTGEFDIQKETGTGVTLSFNGRIAWERSLNDQTVLGYFIGVEGNDSNLTSTFAGDHKRLAGSAGIYALTELSEGVFAAGYGSLGIAQGDLDVTDGTDAVAGDYTYNTMALGGQLSGSIEQEVYELQPTLSLNYSKSFVGDISLTQTTAGTASALAVTVGNTEFAELIASPRFLIPVAMTEDSTFTTVGVVAPRLLCEYSKSSGSSASNCGGGLEIGLNNVSRNGMINLNAGLRFDRINGADRQALSLQGSMDF
jgi:hypothetical protein